MAASTTNENNKRIAKNTLYLYLRMFIILVVSLYTSRVVLNALGISDFGIYNVVGGVVAMMGLLKGAMSAATTRYITFELGRRDMEQLHKTFCVSVMIYMIISAVFLFIAETAGLWFVNTYLNVPPDRMKAVNWVYQFTIMSVIVEMMSQPYNSLIIAHEKMSFYSFVSIVEVFLKLGIAFLIYFTSFDNLIVYGFLMLCSSVIIRVIYGIYCKRMYEESKFRIYRDKKLFFSMLSYSWWNLFGSASGLIKGQGINILLNIFFSTAVNAARGIAFQVNSAISQFSHNFYTAVRPQITKYYAQNDLENMFKLVFRSSKFSFYLNLLFGIPLVIETPVIIQLWLGQVPEYVVVFTRLIIIISLIDAMAHPLMTSIHSTGKVALYQSVVGTLNILNLPVSYAFLKFGYQPVAVFYVSLVITVVSLFVRLMIVKRYIPQFPVVRYIFNVFGTCFLVGLAASSLPVLAYILLPGPGWSLVAVIAVSVISVISTVYIFGFSKGERSFITQMLKKKLLRR